MHHDRAGCARSSWARPTTTLRCCSSTGCPTWYRPRAPSTHWASVCRLYHHALTLTLPLQATRWTRSYCATHMEMVHELQLPAAFRARWSSTSRAPCTPSWTGSRRRSSKSRSRARSRRRTPTPHCAAAATCCSATAATATA